MTALDLDRPTWMADAVCRGEDVSTFFPAESAGPKVDAAKAICARCDVQVECLAYALSAGEESGIWGGFDERERRTIRRGRDRARRPSLAQHGTISGFSRHHLDGTPPLRDVPRRTCEVPGDDPAEPGRSAPPIGGRVMTAVSSGLGAVS